MKNVALILLLFLATTSFSQSSSDELKSGGRVKADKPTVYVEYVCQDKKEIYLRMYNNTIWHISVTADELYPHRKPIKLRNGINTYAAPNDKEIPLQYRVEKWALPWENVKVPQIAYPDNGFSIGLVFRVQVIRQVVAFGEDLKLRFNARNSSHRPIYLVQKKPASFNTEGGAILLEAPLPIPIEHGDYNYTFTRIGRGREFSGQIIIPRKTYTDFDVWPIEIAFGYVTDFTGLDKRLGPNHDPAVLRGLLYSRLKIVSVGTVSVKVVEGSD